MEETKGTIHKNRIDNTYTTNCQSLSTALVNTLSVRIEGEMFNQGNAQISEMLHSVNHLSVNDNTGRMGQCFGSLVFAILM